MQAESPSVTPSAQVVGNAFVQQYYLILHQSPELVYRFYHDSSVLSRPDPNGVMSSVTTMQGINDRIVSLNYKDYIAEIKTADAQQSFGEGVIVLVTGYLTGRDNLRKKFVQSFFLAPQEKGYFVLNDVFRYLEDNESAEVILVSANGVSEDVQAAPLAPEQEKPSHVPDHPGGEVPEHSVEEDLNNEPEVCDPPENEDGSITEEHVVEPPTHLNERDCVTVTSAPSASQSQEDAPKQSYASILKAMKARPSPPPAKTPANNFKAKPPSNDQEIVGSAKPAPSVEASASTSTNGPGKTNVVEAEGYSIYVRNLPQNATAAQLEEVFATFGPIKQDGIQVRSNKQGFCFGFVEFEALSSMSSAIQASPIIIGRRKVVIEEKKTTTRGSNATSFPRIRQFRVNAVVSTNSGRGRYPSSRGGFRNENFRGGRGGNYGGGPGFGRNDFKGGQAEYSARPRRGPEGYQRVDQNGSGPKSSDPVRKGE